MQHSYLLSLFNPFHCSRKIQTPWNEAEFENITCTESHTVPCKSTLSMLQCLFLVQSVNPRLTNQVRLPFCVAFIARLAKTCLWSYTTKSLKLQWSYRRKLLKILWEKKKMLVNSIFSFSHNVFNPCQRKESFELHKFCFVDYKIR